MKKYLKIIVIALAVVIVLTGAAIPILASASGEEQQGTVSAEAAETTEGFGAVSDTAIVAQADAATKSTKAWAAALVVGMGAAAGAIGMALAISKSVEGTARQPEASGKIQTMLMLGLVFIETAIIYALIVAILIVFVL